MPVKHGSTDIGGVFKGTTEIASIYKGTTLVYENWATLTAEGVPPLTLQKCKDDNMVGYRVYGKSEQPTKNLLDIQNGTKTLVRATVSNYQNGIKITSTQANSSGNITVVFDNLEFGETYVISFTTQRSGTTGGGIRLYVDGTLKVNNINLVAGDYNYTFVAGASTQIYFYGVSNNNVVGDYSIFTNVQLEKSETATTYEPAIPSPYGELAIKSVGDKTKNEFNKNSYGLFQGYYKADTRKLVTYGLNAMIYIPCEPNTTYTISGNGSSATVTQIAYTYTTPAVNVDVYGNVETYGKKATITTDSNAKFLIFYAVRDVDHAYTSQQCITMARENVENLQIEKGSTATEYEPYGYKIPIIVNNTTTNIYLNEPLRQIGNGMGEVLPNGYKQLEYIQSSGTQYIDTGVYGSNKLSVEIDFQPTTSPTYDNNIAIIGSWASTPYSIRYYTQGLYFFYGSDQTDASTGNSALIETKRHKIKTDKNKLYLDGTLIKTYTENTFTTESNLAIFGQRGSSATSRLSSAKLYNCKIYDGDKLIRNFVPCTNSSDVAGLYDTVNDVFYTNNGTGSFTKGPRIFTDYIDFETQKVVRNVKKNILSTSLPNFTFTSTWDNTDYTTFFYYAEDRDTKVFPICNYFAPITTGSGYGPDITQNGLSIDQSSYNIYFKIEKAIATNNTTFNTWLSTLDSDIEVYYPSTVSTKETITLPDILLNKGANVVDVDTGIIPSNLWIKYKGR